MRAAHTRQCAGGVRRLWDRERAQVLLVREVSLVTPGVLWRELFMLIRVQLVASAASRLAWSRGGASQRKLRAGEGEAGGPSTKQGSSLCTRLTVGSRTLYATERLHSQIAVCLAGCLWSYGSRTGSKCAPYLFPVITVNRAPELRSTHVSLICSLVYATLYKYCILWFGPDSMLEASAAEI